MEPNEEKYRKLKVSDRQPIAINEIFAPAETTKR